MQVEIKKRLLGAWRLEKLKVQTKKDNFLKEEKCKGILIFHESNFMSVVIAEDDRPLTSTTDAEKSFLYIAQNAYAGRFEVRGDDLYNFPEVATVVGLTSPQVRKIVFDSENEMTLKGENDEAFFEAIWARGCILMEKN